MKKLRDYQNHIAGINERARMINSSNQKITIIVEGESDKIFFEQWLNDQNARIHFVEGKDYVYEVWENSLKRNFNSIICIVDIDYDKYLQQRFLYPQNYRQHQTCSPFQWEYLSDFSIQQKEPFHP